MQALPWICRWVSVFPSRSKSQKSQTHVPGLFKCVKPLDFWFWELCLPELFCNVDVKMQGELEYQIRAVVRVCSFYCYSSTRAPK
jgi:hypothetical protein